MSLTYSSAPLREFVFARLLALGLGADRYRRQAVGVNAACEGVVARVVRRIDPVGMRECPEIRQYGCDDKPHEIHPPERRHCIHPLVLEDVVIDIVVVDDGILDLMTLFYRDAVYVDPLGIARAVEFPVADDGMGIEAPVGSLGVPAGGMHICDGSKCKECEQQFFYHCGRGRC